MWSRVRVGVGVGFACIGARTELLGSYATLRLSMPGTGPQPYSVQPLPPVFDSGNNGIWDTFFGVDLAALDLDTSTAGLRVPTLGELFSLQSIPPELQGSLESVRLNVTFYTRVEFQLTYTAGGNQTINGLFANVEIGGYPLVTPVPAVDAPFPATTALVVDSLNLTANGIQLGDGAPGNFPTTATAIATGQNTFEYDFGSVPGDGFAIFEDLSASYAAFPFLFDTISSSTGTGNYALTTLTWGGTVFSLTYTWVPESDWAWAGLPVVFGGWMLRRRFVNARTPSTAALA